jgi:hypothetical protein
MTSAPQSPLDAEREVDLARQLATTQQQLAFSRNVEGAKVITRAVAQKSTARSRRTSLIGLLLGAIAAGVAAGRLKRAVPV